MIDLSHGTHLPVLIEVMNITTGDVLELGAGLYSTPLFYFWCKVYGRKFVSYENDYEWYKKIWNYKSPEGLSVSPCSDNLPLECYVQSQGKLLEYHYVEKWDLADIDKKWDVVLVDHSPPLRRKEEIKRLANLANYVIVHDTNPRLERKYRFSEIYPLFKFRKDFTYQKPYTTVLSNFKDLSNL